MRSGAHAVLLALQSRTKTAHLRGVLDGTLVAPDRATSMASPTTKPLRALSLLVPLVACGPSTLDLSKGRCTRDQDCPEGLVCYEDSMWGSFCGCDGGEDCPAGEMCAPWGTCTGEACFPPSQDSPRPKRPCKVGETCSGTQCVPGCSADIECGTGYRCMTHGNIGACLAACEKDSDCDGTPCSCGMCATPCTNAACPDEMLCTASACGLSLCVPGG